VLQKKCMELEYSDEVTLVCLGPLSNAALAFATQPEIVAELSSLVVMGGNSEGVGNVTSSAEFNFFFDAEAAAAVLDRSQACESVLVVPWETCARNNVDLIYSVRSN